MSRPDADVVRGALTAAMVLDHNRIQYRRRGNELRTRHCPACGQRTRASVAINAVTGAWSCHAHGCKGDIFALVAGYAGLDVVHSYPQVLELGAGIAGMWPDGDSCSDLDWKLTERHRSETDRAVHADSERKAALAAMPARWEALDCRSSVGERYLERRGIDPVELRHRGDVVRYSPSGDPAVALRDLATGAIVGIQYRCLSGNRKLTSERGSQIAGSALLGGLADIDPDGVDVAILVEGLADTLAACLAFSGCAVYGAPGWAQLEAVSTAIAPRVVLARGWLLVTVDNDDQGVKGARAAVIAAVRAGLRYADPMVVRNAASIVGVVEVGEHHDLADAFAAGWRWTWPGQVAS